MLAVATSAGEGRYQGGEWDVTYQTVTRPSRRPLVWCHGQGGTALGDYLGFGSGILRHLAQNYTIVAADLGFNTFGNDTGMARVQAAIDYLDLPGPVTLVGASMGACVALNYATRNPETVRAVAGIIPLVDLNIPDGHGSKAQLNLAYPPAYDDANPEHRAHNPMHFADQLPMPVSLWTSSDDPAVPPATADAFVAARPQTKRVVFGAFGHAGVNVAGPLVADWLAGIP